MIEAKRQGAALAILRTYLAWRMARNHQRMRAERREKAWHILRRFWRMCVAKYVTIRVSRFFWDAAALICVVYCGAG
jgi:hypothetical protein